MASNRTKHLYGVVIHPSPKVLRLLRGFCPQTILAGKLNVSPKTISDWEQGNTTPTPGATYGLMQHYMEWTGKLGWPSLDLLADTAALDEVKPKPTPQPEGGH